MFLLISDILQDVSDVYLLVGTRHLGTHSWACLLPICFNKCPLSDSLLILYLYL